LELNAIVGGNGYIGSRLTKTFTDFMVFDDGYYSEPLHEVSWSSVSKASTVIWLAAHASNWTCEAEPDIAFANNVSLFQEYLEALDVDQLFIYASSASVYGANPGVSIEDDPLPPALMNYDLHKSICDLIAAKYIAQGKNIIGLRFGTVNGISPHTRTDVMVNAMVRDAMHDGVIRLTNLNRRRSLLFLEDLVEAVRLILANPKPGIYNLHSANYTVADLGDMVAQILGCDIEIGPDSSNPYDFAMSSSKSLETFGNFRKTHLVDVVDGLLSGLDFAHQSRRDELPTYR